jgi:hypothetical protein
VGQKEIGGTGNLPGASDATNPIGFQAHHGVGQTPRGFWPYRTWNSIGSETHTGTCLSRFMAGENR